MASTNRKITVDSSADVNAALIQSFFRELVQNMINKIIVTDEDKTADMETDKTALINETAEMTTDDTALVDETPEMTTEDTAAWIDETADMAVVIGDVIEGVVMVVCASEEGADGDKCREKQDVTKKE